MPSFLKVKNDPIGMLDKAKKELQTDGQAVVEIKVKTGSSRNEILEDREEIIKMAIKEPADKGRANKEIILFLAKMFQISQDDIKIITGKTSSKKKIKLINQKDR